MVVNLTVLNSQLEMILRKLPDSFISDYSDYMALRINEISDRILYALIMKNFNTVSELTQSMRIDNVVLLRDIVGVTIKGQESVEEIITTGCHRFKSICFFDYLKQIMHFEDHNYIDNIRTKLSVTDLSVFLSESKFDILQSVQINKKLTKAFIEANKKENLYEKILDIEICSKLT